MEEKNRKTFSLWLPKGVASVNMFLSSDDIAWLQTGCPMHLGLFNSLLSMMQTGAENPTAHVRKLLTKPGQSQFSETALAAQFGVSRKKIHRILADMERRGLIALAGSNSASVATLLCIEGWTLAEGSSHTNPFFRYGHDDI